MSSIPPVSVALPVSCASSTLEAAFACISRQDHASLEILVILNGSDQNTLDLAHALVKQDPRARILELERPSLPAALNVALRRASHDLVARMDADDTCPPERLRLQAKAMHDRPEMAAVGCAWELADPGANVIATVRPPTEPGDLAWRLLLGNVLAHGSMMLRRDVVLRAGGYDERLHRAQDYDLWMRLLRLAPIGALPEVLYTHVTSSPDDPARSTPDQARIAAACMLDAWSYLRSEASPQLEAALASAISRDDGPEVAQDRIEACLRERGPTREALLAWLWSQWASPPAPRRAAEAARRSLLRETGRRMRTSGVDRVWLWGAGDHTRWLLEHRADLGLAIAGLVDDRLAGHVRHGMHVRSPAVLAKGDAALISSDWHEDAIWKASADARRRGVRVERLYADDVTMRQASIDPQASRQPDPARDAPELARRRPA